MKSLHNKSFKTMLDYTPEEIKYYLELAAKLKADKKTGKEIKTTEFDGIIHGTKNTSCVL